MGKVKKAVFPVAGLGTRFLPATKAQPKEMLPLVDKPIIQHLVEEAVASGIKDIIFITSQTKRAIEDHFDRNFELEYRLQQGKKKALLKEVNRIFKMASFAYVRQQTPKGWPDAILQAESLIGDEAFAVFFGDDVIDSKEPALKQLIDNYESGKILMALKKVADDKLHHYGIVDAKKQTGRKYKINDVVEKPSSENAPSNLAVIGRYIFDPAFLASIKKIKTPDDKEVDPYIALREFMTKDLVYGYEFKGDHFDCGNKLEYLKATVHFGLKHPDVKKDFRNYLKQKKF